MPLRSLFPSLFELFDKVKQIVHSCNQAERGPELQCGLQSSCGLFSFFILSAGMACLFCFLVDKHFYSFLRAAQ